jgi:hypothetical protein
VSAYAPAEASSTEQPGAELLQAGICEAAMGQLAVLPAKYLFIIISADSS